MTAAIKHLHAFVREIEPTEQEWITAIEWLTRVGKMCDEKRQEFIRPSVDAPSPGPPSLRSGGPTSPRTRGEVKKAPVTFSDTK